MQKSLTKTLIFQLDITEGSQRLLNSGQLESQRVINEIYRLDNENYKWDTIEDIVTERSNHVKNTTQQLFDKATTVLNTYYDKENIRRPKPDYYSVSPIRMNHGEGYKLTLTENNEVEFRITALKRKFVRGTLQGSPQHFELLKQAIQNDNWHVGVAEQVGAELHVTVTNEKAEITDKSDSNTVVGVDVNEDCVGVAALTQSGVKDSIVIEYPDIKKTRHEFFTIRKRMQSVGQTSFEREVRDKERQFVHTLLHQVSREIVEWADKFESPVIVFEDLKDMRNGMDYGTRMNKRLHSLPFAQLQEFVSYKAAWCGMPTEKIDPAYTSQECIDCGYIDRSNRRRKRFKCVECGFQDHADRKASVLIGARGLEELDRNVPALNSLCVVRVRRHGNGLCEPADHDPGCTV